MSSLYFYATKSDLDLPLAGFERKFAPRYTLFDFSRAENLQQWDSFFDIPNRGFCDAEQTVASKTFLILLPEYTVQIRPVEQFDGGYRYAIDQLENPSSITLTPGGRRPNNILISGRIATCSQHQDSLRMIRALQRLIRKHFRKVNAYWVGPEAYAAFKAGARLTDAEQSPSEYDLRVIEAEGGDA